MALMARSVGRDFRLERHALGTNVKATLPCHDLSYELVLRRAIPSISKCAGELDLKTNLTNKWCMVKKLHMLLNTYLNLILAYHMFELPNSRDKIKNVRLLVTDLVVCKVTYNYDGSLLESLFTGSDISWLDIPSQPSSYKTKQNRLFVHLQIDSTNRDLLTNIWILLFQKRFFYYKTALTLK